MLRNRWEGAVLTGCCFFVCLFYLPLLILPEIHRHIFSPYMQVALQFTKARSVIYCMTFSFLICLENSIFIILVLLSDDHILENVMCLFPLVWEMLSYSFFLHRIPQMIYWLHLIQYSD